MSVCKVEKQLKVTKSSGKSMTYVQTLDIMNSMNTQRTKLCKYYIGSSTAEMRMQSTDASHNYADTDWYFQHYAFTRLGCFVSDR